MTPVDTTMNGDTAAADEKDNTQDESSDGKPLSRISQRYKTLESEANRFLDKSTRDPARARAYEPTLEELSNTSFSDYIRFTVLQCNDVVNKETEGKRMHTRNYCPPGHAVMTTTRKADYTEFKPPLCWSDGMAKVTLPKGWWDQEGIGKDTTGRGPNWQPGTELGDLMVKNPIKQCVSGIGGVYEFTLLDMPSKTLSEFRTQADAYRKKQVGVELEEDFSDEFCDKLARRFWKRLGPTMEAPLYGADMDGSLFGGDEACGWNVEKLDSCLQLLSPAAGERLPGVTSPYLYVGMWGSVFCAHTEDMNLLSINYLHAGAPKYWYAIAPEDSKRFESLADSHFGHSRRNCPEFLRHKRNLISPAILKKAGIGYTTQIQRPGDAMITFPGSYHFGFNTGFNVAESTNFAVPEWIPTGLEAGVCMCHPHSVRIDMKEFQSLLERYETDVARSTRVGYRQLTYCDWIDRQKEKENREEGEDSSDEENAQSNGKKKKRKKQDGFPVEVVRPLPTEGKGNTQTLMKRASRKSSKEVEDWRLARKLFRASVAPNTKVLCFMVDADDEDAENQCFAGAISEVVDNHVRIHFAGMKRQDDVWMPSNSPKLFLDGGSFSPPEKASQEKKEENGSRKKCRR